MHLCFWFRSYSPREQLSFILKRFTIGPKITRASATPSVGWLAPLSYKLADHLVKVSMSSFTYDGSLGVIANVTLVIPLDWSS